MNEPLRSIRAHVIVRTPLLYPVRYDAKALGRLLISTQVRIGCGNGFIEVAG